MKILFSLLTLAVSVTALSAQSSNQDRLTLFDFGQPGSEDGWYVNIYKKNSEGQEGQADFEPFEDPEKGRVVRLLTESAGKFNVVSPDVTLPEDKNLFGLQVTYRTAEGSEGVALVVCDIENHTYSSAPLPPTNGIWSQEEVTHFHAKKGWPPLDLKKLRRIYLKGMGDTDVAIAKIQLIGDDQ